MTRLLLPSDKVKDGFDGGLFYMSINAKKDAALLLHGEIADWMYGHGEEPDVVIYGGNCWMDFRNPDNAMLFKMTYL